MNTSQLNDKALEKTFSILNDPKYQASTQVLARGLRSSNSIIRAASLQSLLARGTSSDYDIILQSIDRSTPAEINMIRPHTARMTEVIDQGLASSDRAIRQRALWTIAKMELESRFCFLVDAVCNPEDPQQMIAIEVISNLVKSLRLGNPMDDTLRDSARLALLAELARGIESYPQHRVQSIFDWWASLAGQDDEVVVNTVREAVNGESLQGLLRYLENFKSEDCLDLVARFLWNLNGDDCLLKLAAKRNDPPFVEALGKLCRRLEPTKELARNLKRSDIEYVFLSEEIFLDDRISLVTKTSLVNLMTIQRAAIEDILPRIAWLVLRIDATLENEVALLLERQKPMNTDIAVLVLSDALDAPDVESSVPSPWKQSMRDALQGLIDGYARVGKRLQGAISHFFREFKCEKLLEKLLDWPASHLSAYASLSRLGDSQFLDKLMNEMDSISPVRRQRGVRAAHLFGMDHLVEELIINKLSDPVDEVRIEAICALADSTDCEQAISLLGPLETGTNPEIDQAVRGSIMKLREAL
jgi:hypothetical protein